MILLHDLSISWKTAKECKELIQELFYKFKEFDYPIYENVSKPTVELLGRAHECVLCINIHLTDDILLQTEQESLNMLQSLITGAYKRPVEIDQIVVINLFHDGTQINLRQI